MNSSPPTRPSLLIRIRDHADRESWAEFVEVYAPLVYGFVRRQGLQDADSADLTQDVLRSVAGAISRLDYDPRKGSFRGWLFTIVRNRLRNELKRRQRREQGSGDSAIAAVIADQPADDDWEEQWNHDHEQRLFAWAAKRVQAEVESKTWQAFQYTTIEGRAAKEVAEELTMTVAAVYLAKSRVMTKLRELVREADDVAGEDVTTEASDSERSGDSPKD